MLLNTNILRNLDMLIGSEDYGGVYKIARSIRECEIMTTNSGGVSWPYRTFVT